MSTLQKFFMAALPKTWAEAMREDSMRWQIRCGTCGMTRSYWDVGGIRWKAASKSKQIGFHCPNCQCLRLSTVEKV